MIADDQRHIQMRSFFVRCKNTAQPCVSVGVPVRNINSTVICPKQTLPTLVPGTNVVKKASNLDILTLKPENGYKEPDVSAVFL